LDKVIEALSSLKVPLESVKPDPRNARHHPAGNLKAIMDSLDAYGQRKPIVVNAKTMMIEAGNGMWEAAQALGWGQVAVAFVKDDKAVASAYGIMDNQSALLAEWDLPTLKDLLQELDDGETNMELTGFSTEEIEDLMTQFHVPEVWHGDDAGDNDGIENLVGYNLASFWKEKSRDGGQAFKYMLRLPQRPTSTGATVKHQWSRTNSEATERIIRTYMREGDLFYEMCSGWVTFSSTAKFWGFSGKASDIWDKALRFDREQIDKMPGDGNVEIVKADCRQTGEQDDTYDFIHSNPPFFSLEEYSDNPDDLSGLGSYDRWLMAMVDMAKEAERILKPNGLANFVLNDYRKDSYLINMHSDFMIAILTGTNLKMWDMVVSEVISQALRFRKKAYENRRTVKCHDYIMTFRKC